MTYRILQANPAVYLYQIYGLQKRHLPGAPVLSSIEGLWWVALTEHGDVAAIANLMPSATTPNWGYLARCAVRPAHRGHGLQRRLIAVRVAYAKRLGMPGVISDTTDNPRSGANLEAMGFERYEPAKPYAYAITHYWRKILRKRSAA